ncbi:MAG: hypothetical protein AAGF28_12630 [Pseudomonadota bacterium]
MKDNDAGVVLKPVLLLNPSNGIFKLIDANTFGLRWGQRDRKQELFALRALTDGPSFFQGSQYVSAQKPSDLVELDMIIVVQSHKVLRQLFGTTAL